MHTPSRIATDTIMADPHARLALDIIAELHRAGYVSYLAGGCVRDALLGKRPKDYDVATSARPEQIREVFGHKRTLPIGVAFGVMCVLPARRGEQEPVEVATFRSDGNYSDGRRPDRVHFSSPELDAQRRDFTINGLFFDPAAGEVYDFVGGVEDLGARLIRAIGDPVARFAEDRLRLLRAVRFATTYGFELEPSTFAAVVEHAGEVTVCSGERIGAEMRRLLKSRYADRGLQLLLQTELAGRVLPGIAERLAEPSVRRAVCNHLQHEMSGEFAARLALVALAEGDGGAAAVHRLARHWKLSNDEVAAAEQALKDLPELLRAEQLSWSQLQPRLVTRYVETAVAVARAVAGENAEQRSAMEVVEARLRLPPEELDPAPLLSGQDLIAMGLRPGPKFKQWLAAVRAFQLDGELDSAESARRWVREQITE